MKRCLFAVAIFSLLLTAPAAVFAQTDSGTGEKEIRDALEKYSEALLHKDVTALKQIWADDYTFINGAGEIVTKDQRLANLASRETALDTITRGNDTKVRVFGGDSGICTSRLTINGKYSGKAASGDYQSMTVWVKRGDIWQLVANQLTRINGKH